MSENREPDKTTIYDKQVASPIEETLTKKIVKTLESHADHFAIAGEELTKRFKGLSEGEDLNQQMDQWQESITAHDGAPRYAMKDLLGQGAQGLVFGVQDKDCGREIALKTMRGDDRVPTQIARFVHEVQVTAQLEHPGIVPVHDLNVLPDGTLFYTMKKIHGRQLSEEMSAHVNPVDNRFNLLQLFLKVCDTMSFAHSHGVLHRDLKPSNIMVGDYGEVLVVDWGLSKVMDQADVISVRSQNAQETDSGIYVTREGHAVGTPAYMSPEQAMGHRDTLDQRSDIYALGVILYEMLTKALPYTGLDVETVLDQVAKGVWVPITKQSMGKEIPAQLAAIVHKALAHDPKQRYQNVNELSADLRSFLAGESVTAYADNLPERFLRFMRKNHAQVKTGLILSSIFLMAILAATYYLSLKETEEINKARTRAFYYLTHGFYDDAKNQFKQIVEDNKLDYLAKQGLDRAVTLKKIQEKNQRASEEAGRRQKRIEEAGQLLSKAEQSLVAKHWEEALKFLNQAFLLLDEQDTDEIKQLRQRIAAGRQADRDARELAGHQASIVEIRETLDQGDLDSAFAKANAMLENLRNDKFNLRNGVVILRDEIKTKLDKRATVLVQQARQEEARQVMLSYSEIITAFTKKQQEYQGLIDSKEQHLSLGIKSSEIARIDNQLEKLQIDLKDLNLRIVTVLGKAENLDPSSSEVNRAWADHCEREVKRLELLGDDVGAAVTALRGSKYDLEGRYKLLFAERALVKNISRSKGVSFRKLANQANGVLAASGDSIALPETGSVELDRGRYVVFVDKQQISALRLMRGQTFEFHYKKPLRPQTTTAISYIPGGFTFNSKQRRTDRYVSGFWMARHEITCGEYLEFLNAIGDKRLRDKHAPHNALDQHSIWRADGKGRYKLLHYFRQSKEGWEIDPNTPVYGITYTSVLAYIEWRKERDRAAGKAWRWRLPGEYEWRLAAQGGDGRVYPWGDKPENDEGGLCHSARTLERKENEKGRSSQIVLPVGSFVADQSVAGIFDLGGSLSEFVDAHNQQNNLVMICGGSFQDKDDFRFRTSSVRYIDSGLPSVQVGFRLVLDLDNE